MWNWGLGVALAMGLGLAVPQGAQGATRYWKGSGTWTSANQWGSASGGPYTLTWAASDDAVNDVAAATVTFASATVKSITANENLTFSPAGTLTTGGLQMPVFVAAGKVLDLAGQGISTAAGTGVNKSGDGELRSSNGNTYPGGFTISAGTMTIGGVNAMGSGGALTINGGVLQASSTSARLLVGKFAGGIVVGGNFGFGGSGVLQFNNNVALGASTRIITNNCSAQIVWAGIVSGDSGSGLTFEGSGGTFLLTGANTFSGDLTINGGSVMLATNGAIASVPNISIGGGATFDVSALTTALTLASGQGLKATGTASAGTIATASGKGLTTAANSPINFTAFNGSVAPLTLSGAGTLTLQTGNPVTVTVANGGTPLAAGATYKLIAKGASGTVAGVPSSVTVDGDGVSGIASLEITGGELYLKVEESITFHAKVPDWTEYGPGVPAIWGPFPGPGWVGFSMTTGTWWTVTIPVADASAPITYQLRFAQGAGWKYQKASGSTPPSGDESYTTASGHIWIDATTIITWNGDDFSLPPAKTTLVVLSLLTAQDENGQVVIRWETSSEDNTVGFFVERWDGAAWARVNDQIVYASGQDGMGASYSLVDAGAQVNEVYSYRLVEVETSGSEEVYGPYDLSTGFAFRQPVEFNANGTASIRWLSRQGENYSIWRSTDLTQGLEGFKTLKGGISATPPENTYIDNDAGSMGMYRITVDSE